MSELKKANNVTPPKTEEKTPSVEALKTEQVSGLQQLESRRPDVSEKPDRHKYFIGMTPDAKRTYLTIGGHSFPVFTCAIGQDQSGQDVEIVQRGGIIELSDSEVEKLKEAVLRKGIRFVGDSTTTFFAEGRGYQKNEFPTAMFCYLHKIDDLAKAFPLGWREQAEIPTMMKRDSHATELLGTGWKNTKGEERPLRNPYNVDKIVKKEF